MKKAVCALVAAVLCLGWGAGAGQVLAASAKGTDLMAGLSKSACAPRPGTPDEAARKGIGKFSADLLEASLEKNGGNVMVSPASVFLALAMAANGAEGSTKADMLAALAGKGMPLDRVNRASRDWMARLSRTGEKTTLGIANSIWFNKTFRPARPFLQRNADFFGAAARRLDFADRGALAVINGWVKNATRGTIDRIIEKIRRDDVMFLVNAVYFKSDWQVPFEKDDTGKAVFHAPKRDVETDFMHRTGGMTLLAPKGASGVALPYDDGRFVFFALLPEGKTTPREWFARQDRASVFGELVRMAAKKPAATVRLALPKFESRYEDGLVDELTGLGMGAAFDAARADFSGMGENRARDLFIGEVRHKTFVRVDEKGTEASAVTSVGIRLTSMPPSGPELVFDRPFLYGILDLETGIPLFTGVMEDPTAR